MVSYTDELATEICDKLASGHSLRSICKEELMPSQYAVFDWIHKNEAFAKQYAHARQTWADAEFENMMHIADTPQEGQKTKITEDGVETVIGDMIEHRRLQVDTRKWALARMSPKKYGDSTTLKGDKDNPLSSQGNLTDAELTARAIELIGKTGIGASFGNIALTQDKE